MKWIIVGLLVTRILLQASIYLHQLNWLHRQLPDTPTASVKRFPNLRHIIQALVEQDEEDTADHRQPGGTHTWLEAKRFMHQRTLGSLWMCLSLDLALLAFLATLRRSWAWAERIHHRFPGWLEETIILILIYGVTVICGLAIRDCVGRWVVGSAHGGSVFKTMVLRLVLLLPIAAVARLGKAWSKRPSFLSTVLLLLLSAGLWLLVLLGPIAQRNRWAPSILGDCNQAAPGDLPGWPQKLRSTKGILKCWLPLQEGGGGGVFPLFSGDSEFTQRFWGIFPSPHSTLTTVMYYRGQDHPLVADEWLIAGLVHEVGHVSRMHGLAMVLFNQVGILLGGLLVWWLLQPQQQRLLLGSFLGVKEEGRIRTLFLVSLVFGLVYSLVWSPLSHLFYWIIEFDADQFAKRHGYADDLVDLIGAHQYYTGEYGMGASWRIFWEQRHPTALMRIARLLRK